MDDVTYVVQGDRAVEEKASNYKTYVKVFLYFALGLIITGVVAICFSLLLQNLYTNGYAFEATYITVTIVSVIAMIISALFIGIKAFSKGSKLIIPYIIYSVSMGCLLSGLAIFIDSPYTFGIIFLITAAVFAAMALLGALIGEKVNVLFVALGGFLVGIGLLCLCNFLLFPWLLAGSAFAFDAYSTIYWVIELAFLIVMMLYVAIDINRLKRVAGSKVTIETNLALYFAFALYTDFINIFVRILYIFLASKNRK